MVADTDDEAIVDTLVVRIVVVVDVVWIVVNIARVVGRVIKLVIIAVTEMLVLKPVGLVSIPVIWRKKMIDFEPI